METHKFHEYFRRYSPDSLTKIAPDQIAFNEANYERVKSQFRYTVGCPDGSPRTIKQQTWCRDNLSERATKTGFAESYATVMPQANQILHGSVVACSITRRRRRETVVSISRHRTDGVNKP